jgi:hypothetical protein
MHGFNSPLTIYDVVLLTPTNDDQVAYARCHLDWARKNLETWTEAKDEVDKIVAR